MQLQNWVDQAIEHWKEYRPKIYARLKKEGTLEKRALEAAQQTNKEMQQLTNKGMRHDEEWEILRDKYLFLPEEKGEKTEDPASADLWEVMKKNQEIREEYEQD